MIDRRREHGFTMVEMLVVIGIIGLLVALILPSVSALKQQAAQTQCANNLRQLGTATINYLSVYDSHLPQMTADNPFGPGEVVVGTLFGGKKGELQMFGLNEFGAQERPLNAFLGNGSQTDEALPVYECPLDHGQPAQPPFLPGTDSMYDFVGTSYTLNDHSLDGDDCATLVPTMTGDRPGGRMPRVDTPTKTWLLGDLIMYNYQEGGDRGQRWHFDDTICNLCFVDGHVEQEIEIPESTFGADGFIEQNTTKHYTFLPSDRWLERNCGP